MNSCPNSTAISTAQNIPINQVVLTQLLVALTRLHIDGALVVDFYILLHHDYSTSSPEI